MLNAVISAIFYYQFHGSILKLHVVLASDLVMVSNSHTLKYRHMRAQSGNDEGAHR